jgi:hypothetical protein
MLLGCIGLVACGGKEGGTEQTPTATPTPTPIPSGKQNDANSGGDVSAELESPYPIDYGEWKGTLTGDDDGDAYGIRWNPGDTIDIVITPSKGLDISFYYVAGGTSIGPRNEGVKGEPESIQMTTDIAKNIKRFDILTYSVSGSGDYKLNIVKTPQNDGGKGQDAPSDVEQPLPVSAGLYEGCYLGSKDEFDYYSINLEAGQKIHITIDLSSELDAGIDVKGYGFLTGLYLPREGFTGALRDPGFVNSNFKGEAEETYIAAGKAGIYKFGVGKFGETKGNYTLGITYQASR